jgi:thiosulfate/3-mercaptopyruvate sulfurtransferase
LDNARKAQNGSNAFQVLDARPYARFTGEAAEPRVGLSSGHMPGSISVAFNEVIGPDGQFYDDQKLCQIFQEKGVDLSKEIVTSCGKINHFHQYL